MTMPGRRGHFERSAPDSHPLIRWQLNIDEEESKKIGGVYDCG